MSMQPSFCRVWKEIGVPKWTWEVRPTLMIPTQRPGLVLVRNAAGHALRAGPGVTFKRIDKTGVVDALDKYLAGNGVTSAQLKDLSAALWAAITPELSSGGVLLSVEAKHAGTSWLRAGKFEQSVSVTQPLVLDVTFKFLHHLDEDGKMMPATHKDPAFVDGWISSLNWILGAQANVWFSMENAVPVKIDRQLGKPVNDSMFREFIMKEKDVFADVTVFLVGKWSGRGDAGGTFYPDPGDVIALDDKPAIPVVEGNDVFIVTLAHELVHFVLHFRGNKLNIHHLPDQHALLNKLVESTVVTPLLQGALNPGAK
jgi:hypothetical protein